MFNPNHQFNIYGRSVGDGTYMVMIQNHGTCRAFYHGSSLACQAVQDRIERECSRNGKFPVLLFYFKKAKAKDIYKCNTYSKEAN